MATAAAQAITDRNGVKKPIHREMETNKTPAKSRYLENRSKQFAALIKKIAATEMRRRTNANPGHPWGNMGNNRCMELSVVTSSNAAYPNWGYASIPLLGDSKLR